MTRPVVESSEGSFADFARTVSWLSDIPRECAADTRVARRRDFRLRNTEERMCIAALSQHFIPCLRCKRATSTLSAFLVHARPRTHTHTRKRARTCAVSLSLPLTRPCIVSLARTLARARALTRAYSEIGRRRIFARLSTPSSSSSAILRTGSSSCGAHSLIR